MPPLASPDQIPPRLRGFTPYVPGLTIEEIREKYGLERVIKLASNENPLGVSPLAQKVIEEKAAEVFRYPQGGWETARAIARFHGIDEKRVVVGNGSDELIDLVMRLRAVPGESNIVAFRPCFGMYPLFARLCGVEFRQVPLNGDFSFPLESMRAAVDERTALVFITTPDNPSGFCPPAGELAAFAASLPPGALLVVDEAYMDFCSDEAAHSLLGRLEELPNVAVLRTFSKSFGLAGLRLGYAVLPPALAEAARSVRSPFSVNRLAEAAGCAALADTAFREKTLRLTREGRRFLTDALRQRGFTVYPSQANFILVRPPGGVRAAALYEELLRRGVIIRQLKSGYDLPDHLRITIGTPDENLQLTSAVDAILHA